jgi:hypothetical protein
MSHSNKAETGDLRSRLGKAEIEKASMDTPYFRRVITRFSVLGTLLCVGAPLALLRLGMDLSKAKGDDFTTFAVAAVADVFILLIAISMVSSSKKADKFVQEGQASAAIGPMKWVVAVHWLFFVPFLLLGFATIGLAVAESLRFEHWGYMFFGVGPFLAIVSFFFDTKGVKYSWLYVLVLTIAITIGSIQLQLIPRGINGAVFLTLVPTIFMLAFFRILLDARMALNVELPVLVKAMKDNPVPMKAKLVKKTKQEGSKLQKDSTDADKSEGSALWSFVKVIFRLLFLLFLIVVGLFFATLMMVQ